MRLATTRQSTYATILYDVHNDDNHPAAICVKDVRCFTSFVFKSGFSSIQFKDNDN